MPVCFSTAIYSMLTVGNLQSGQVRLAQKVSNLKMNDILTHGIF